MNGAGGLKHTPTDVPETGRAAWIVIHAWVNPTALRAALIEVSVECGLRLALEDNHTAVFSQTEAVRSPESVVVRWRQHASRPADRQTPSPTGRCCLELIVDGRNTAPDDLLLAVANALGERVRAFGEDEIHALMGSMPLLNRYATPDPRVSGWAIIFRDHYVENSLAFLVALVRTGVPTQWIYSLSKGDRTLRRDRVHASLRALGIKSGVLDNTMINAPDEHRTALARARSELDAFIASARQDGRRILVIDDGGLIACGYGETQVDAALELTVSGLKRIAAAGPLDIPVYNLARSALKTALGYPEIADSCIRRLRTLLPAEKLIGRPVLQLGYGLLGEKLARGLRAFGCLVHVVDPDMLTLIRAAEAGFPTFHGAGRALAAIRPVVVLGTSGEDALDGEALRALPDGVYLAPFATRDFSMVPQYAKDSREIPGVGRQYVFDSGRVVTVLGDGRSLNLFEADAIPNQGYDAYRAGTLLAARHICGEAEVLPSGVHTDLVDAIIEESGLYSQYYAQYLAPSQSEEPGTGGIT